MKTIHRQKSKYRPTPNVKASTTFLYSPSITELIKRADQWCDKYGFEYEQPIYKVIEATNTHNARTPDMKHGRVRKNSVERTIEKAKETFYFEARLRKVA